MGAGINRLLSTPEMFNFSANHLALISRMEYRSCVVFLMRDDSTRRVYRLYDFTKSQIITPGQYYCVFGKVNSADKLYLVIESLRPDLKHARRSNAPVVVGGAGGSAMQ
jgi:hypothetical protein